MDEAAYVKAAFLSDVALGNVECPLIDKVTAVDLLGDMHGGYNIETLVKLLSDGALGEQAATELKHTLLMFDAFYDVAALAKDGNANAQSVMQSGLMPSGLQSEMSYRTHSKWSYSRSLARPIQTICHRRPTPGQDPTSHSTRVPCTR